MLNEYWSWLLTIIGVTGFILAGAKVWWCWYINIACQALWFVYAIVTSQYGFIAAALVYTAVFTRNAIAWTREHKAVPDITEDESVELELVPNTLVEISERTGISQEELELHYMFANERHERLYFNITTTVVVRQRPA